VASLFGILSVGRNGMQAHQYATQVTSHNAANVATEGYTRRLVNISPVTHTQPGNGARADGSRRIMDTFVHRRLLGSRSFDGESKAKSEGLNMLDSLFSIDGLNLNRSLDDFHEALSQVTTHPSDHGTRTVFLARAKGLTTAFNQASFALEEARADANDRIVAEVKVINSKITQIGKIGRDIAETEIGGVEAGDLRDERDRLIREVSDSVPVNVLEVGGGQIRLLLGSSKPLVSADGTVHPLEARVDPATGDISVYRTTVGLLEDVSPLISSGSIRGIIDARDGGIAQAKQELDQLAFDVSTTYNTAHAAGFGLDGVGGRNLFNTPAVVLDAAKFMTLDPTVDGNPEAIAAASAVALLPGDNRNALALQALQDTNIALGGSATAGEALSQMMGTAANEVQRARATASQASAIHSQVEAMHKSVSGVSIDEEMVALVQYQRGYQAALKIISTADQLLQEVINLKR